MSERVEKLFAEFLDARQAGQQPDPAAYIAQAGDEGEALAGMLAAYLAMHPADHVSEEAVAALAASAELEMPRPWPELIPGLRERRGIVRKKLLLDLVAALGAPQTAGPQIEGYLHELETGQRDPRRVRPAVVDALARALDAPPSLLEMSRWIDMPKAYGTHIVFARRAVPSEFQSLRIDVDEPTPDPWIADLFSGGPDG